MNKFLIILLITISQTYAATLPKPLAKVKNVLTGKYSWSISVGAFGAAEGSDYKTTVKDVSSGVGVEANPLLTNNNQLVQNRLIGLKLFTFVEPISAESYLYYKMNSAQRSKYGKWMIIGNWIGAVVVGGVALHNREIYQHSP